VCKLRPHVHPEQNFCFLGLQILQYVAHPEAWIFIVGISISLLLEILYQYLQGIVSKTQYSTSTNPNQRTIPHTACIFVISYLDPPSMGDPKTSAPGLDWNRRRWTSARSSGGFGGPCPPLGTLILPNCALQGAHLHGGYASCST
jgi:hypothetical protein